MSDLPSTGGEPADAVGTGGASDAAARAPGQGGEPDDKASTEPDDGRPAETPRLVEANLAPGTASDPTPRSAGMNGPPRRAAAGAGESRSAASGSTAEASAGTGEKKDRSPREPRTGELVTIFLLNSILAVGAMIAILVILMGLDRSLNTANRTSWEQPKGVRLRSGPAAFRYDPVSRQLIHRGPIDDREKSLLVSLAEPRDESYERALEDLSLTAGDGARMALIYTLLLGGTGSLIGVLMRNMTNFVGVVCYKKNFYFPVWWPWYFMRPFQAFLAGVVLVILVKSDLLITQQGAAQGNLWFVGLAVLAGFGMDDFLGRLRVLSKTLFPPEEAKAKAVAKAEAPAPKVEPLRPPVGGDGVAGAATDRPAALVEQATNSNVSRPQQAP